MIDLDKAGKKATGLKDPNKSLYKYKKDGNDNNDRWISRSKFDDFKKCPKCFYLEVIKGFMPPGTPQFTMNKKTDELLKKEFDFCREEGISHKFLKEKDLEHIIPYKNNEIAKNIYGKVIKKSKTDEPYKVMEAWRTNYHGVQARFKKENIVLYGSVDDIWLDTKNDKFIMVDYKSQANVKSVSQDTYFKDAYKSSYQTQLDFYAYLLKAQNIKKVSDDAYLYVVNARGLEQEFDNKLLFEPTLIRTKIKTDYLEDEIQNMIDTMNSTKIPDSNKSCNNCAYARQRSRTDTL